MKLLFEIIFTAVIVLTAIGIFIKNIKKSAAGKCNCDDCKSCPYHGSRCDDKKGS